LVATVASAWKRCVETEEPYDIERRIRRADGVHRWFHVRGMPLRDTEGRVVRHREREVMALVVCGLLNTQVGSELHMSEITVKADRGR
jgi:DNA-binding NarL/FixJ family response regulator